EDGSNRRENITDWAAANGPSERRGLSPQDDSVPGGDEPRRSPSKRRTAEAPEITKWDIFYYVYGVLHHPGYRTKFADNLKRELPRIPFAPDFWAFSTAGEELARLHLDYETLEPY